MTAYYNEIEPFAAAWLRNLIAAGAIAPGEVDERSIEDVRPGDLAGFTQCHFFAGIGVWSHALRSAGWPDDRPVWTGSCPCQPFSAAGKGGGFADERHLWPAFFHLIGECRPTIVLGEQVASKDGLGWLDLVSADLEGADYSFGAADSCAAGYGAPHIRQRLYWLAHAHDAGLAQRSVADERRGTVWDEGQAAAARFISGGLADAAGSGRHAGLGYATAARDQLHDEGRGETGGMVNANGAGRGEGRRDDPAAGHRASSATARGAGGLADAEGAGGRTDAGAVRSGPPSGLRDPQGQDERRAEQQNGWSSDSGATDRPGPTNGFWRDADWLGCRDAKWRPVKPGSFPLAHGYPGRVGKLRAAGNAIVAPQAQAFVEAAQDILYPAHAPLDLRLSEDIFA